MPSLREAAPAPSSFRGVRALSGDIAPALAGAIPLDAAAAAAASTAIAAGAGPVVPMAAYQWPDKFAFKRGVAAVPVSGVPQAAAPIVSEVSGVPKAAKVIPIWYKPGTAPQVLLTKKTILPARQMALPQMSVLLPSKSKPAVSGVSGASVPASKWDKIAAAVGGK